MASPRRLLAPRRPLLESHRPRSPRPGLGTLPFKVTPNPTSRLSASGDSGLTCYPPEVTLALTLDPPA